MESAAVRDSAAPVREDSVRSLGDGVGEREGCQRAGGRAPPHPHSFQRAGASTHALSLSLIPARPTPRPLNARRDLAVEVHSLQAGQGARPAHGG